MTRRFLLSVLAILALTPMALFADDLDSTMVQLFHAQQALAKTKSADAEYYLGEMYENGYGTAPDLDKAFEWYGKAARQGYSEALQKMRSQADIRREYQEKQKLAAQRAARNTEAQAQDQKSLLSANSPVARESQEEAAKEARLADFRRRYAAYRHALERDRQREAYPME